MGLKRPGRARRRDRIARIGRDIAGHADWVLSGSLCDETFAAVTRTADEPSFVCRATVVPPSVHTETGWRALRVAGRLDDTGGCFRGEG